MRYDSVYISPHLDDVVFSCGGLISKQVAKGERVLVVSLFTKDQESRIAEERKVAERAGYDIELLDFSDAPMRSLKYRIDVYSKPLRKDEKVYKALVAELTSLLNKFSYERCYVPLAVGGHVDHVLTFRACKEVVPVDKRIYYEEVPYCLMRHQVAARLDGAQCGMFTRHPLYREWFETYRHVMGRPKYGGSLYRRLRWSLPVMGAMLYHVINARAKKSSGVGGRLRPFMEDVSDAFEDKLKLSKCYDSQWGIFFRDENHYKKLMKDYMRSITSVPNAVLERYWLPHHAKI